MQDFPNAIHLTPPATTAAAAAAAAGDQSRSNVRRRLIQSTLFPLKAQDKAQDSQDRKEGDCVEIEDEEEECGDEEEYGGSQGKRKRNGKKTKGEAKPRRARKVGGNGMRTPTKPIVVGEADTEVEESPQSLKKKQKVSRRNGRINGVKVLCLDNSQTSPIEQVQASPPVPNLGLEAKLATEEYSRVSAGRKLHPFFSAWKVGKNNMESPDPESNFGMATRKDKHVKFGPIHVLEDDEDYLGSMDWSNWTFCNGVVSNAICKEASLPSVFDAVVGPLRLDDIYKLLASSKVSNLQGALVNRYLAVDEGMPDVHSKSLSLSIDKKVSALDLSQVMETNPGASNLGFNSHNDVSISSEAVEKMVLQERMDSYCLNRGNQPENSLWTCKYQPEKAMEVCGNNESVKLIKEWLQSWRERDLRTTNNFLNSTNGSRQETYESTDEDCDSEYMEEGSFLKNVLFVTGPVGSGKSAAIYACAKEQGFQVIEVNASDWRNGPLIKQQFGEAVGLHWLKRTQESPLGSVKKPFVKPCAVSRDGAVTTELENGILELIDLSDDDCAEAAKKQKNFDLNDSVMDSNNGDLKTLILFEEVDAKLCEDRGFISTIQLLADTGKRPMILTANTNNSILPISLDREEVLFRMPSLRELLFHVKMVCFAEGAEIPPDIIERYITYCKWDIRKLLTHLQFWCQGKLIRRDYRKLKQLYRPLLFDLEAAHCLLPKLVPWHLPSQLGEAVEREITLRLSIMTDSDQLLTVRREEMDGCYVDNDLNGGDGVNMDVEAKKDVILKNHFADNEDFIPPVNACEVSSSSGSPVAFSRRILKRTTGTVLSSDSEDEISNEDLVQGPFYCVQVGGNESVDYSRLILGHPVPDESLNCLFDSLHCHEEAEKEKQQQLSERIMHGQCQSVDISCVPESTIVPETVVYDGRDLRSTADQTEATSPVMVEDSCLVMSTLHEVSKCTFDIDLNVSYEEIGDSYSKIGDNGTISRRFEGLDECSRMVFHRGAKCLKKSPSRGVVSSVQETWNELRLSDLRHFSTLEHQNALQVVELAYRMSNLLSGADLLFSNCESLTSDYVDNDVHDTRDAFDVCWQDQQLRMASAIAEHGYCLQAKEAAALASNLGTEDRVDLAAEMLASTSSSMALGRLLRLNRNRSQSSSSRSNLKMESDSGDLSFKRERESTYGDILQSIVPPRLYLAVKGYSYHEYLSSLAQISRSEAIRLSQDSENTIRRRIARHYLFNGRLSLSPDDISVLVNHDYYGKSTAPEQQLASIIQSRGPQG
ncbi:hypothetical protein Droror1_Dr00027724 [Drosera rotundifolia]